MNVNPLLKVIFFTLYKNRSDFYKSNLFFFSFFFILQKQIWFLQIIFFLSYKNIFDFYKSNLFFFFLTKIDLIFTNQISFHRSDFFKSNLFFIFFLFYKNRFDFYKSNLIFFIFQKQIWFFLIKYHFFLPFAKTDLIFTNQVSFF